MKKRLEDQTIAIVGAGGGIGQEAARALAAQGARLALGSRREAPLAELTRELAGEGAKVVGEAVDVTSERQVRAFFEQAVRAFGKLDALVYLAGLSIPAPVAAMTEEQYDRTIDVNVKGAFLSAKHFIPHVDPERGGIIVNMGSMASKRANAGAPLYCTAKAAVSMLSQGLALQLKEHNVRVTVLNPGAVDTGFWGDRAVPREQFLTASDVADVLQFVLQLDSRVVVHEINFESFAFFK